MNTVPKLDEKDMLLDPLKRDEVIGIEVRVPPHLLDNNILDHIYRIASEKYESMCGHKGLVKKIKYISAYKTLPIKNENMDTSCHFDVNAVVDIFIPIRKQLIVSKVVKYFPEILRSQHGPIEIISQIDKTIFDEFEKQKNDADTKNKDIMILIRIDDIKYSLNDSNIKCLGTFVRIVTDTDNVHMND